MPRALAPCLVLFALVAPLHAQTYLWGFSSEGRVTVNGTQIEDLSGGAKFDGDIDFDDLDELDEYWNSLALDGSEWWCLRFDGRLSRSGERQDDLAFEGVLDGVWIDMVVRDGERWALRSDGRVSVNGNLQDTLPDGGDDDEIFDGFAFMALATDGDDVFQLRSDGRVFRNANTPAIVGFDAPDDDGEFIDTQWIRIAMDPVSGDIYGLRRDGRVYRFDPDDDRSEGGPPNGIAVASLPFPNDAEDINAGRLYWSLTFTDDGQWHALRGDGKVFREDDDEDPLVDLPGDPDDLDDAIYVDILGVGATFATLREDGRVYVGTDVEEVVDLPKGAYRTLEFGTDAPDLSNVKTKKPVVTQYKVTVNSGDAVTVPVIVTDVDTPPDEIVVTVDTETLPAGMVWDDEALTLTWPEAGPAGNYKVKLTAEDGDNKAVKATVTVKVKDLDDNPDKNKKPVPAKIKKAQALVNVPFSMPILASDPDGDPLTYSVDMDSYPFDSGATFDTKTAVFSWQPGFDALGKVKVQVSVSDGELEKTVKVKLKVEGTLLVLPESED